MKYLCLVYSEEDKLHTLPDSPKDSECIAHAEDLKQRGKLIDGRPLKSVDTATTVRVRDGKLSVTDGPFAETKEQLAGFYMIEVPDLDEAIQVAATIPSARVGSIEVRPIRELEP